MASAAHVPTGGLPFARTAAGFWNTTLSPLHGVAVLFHEAAVDRVLHGRLFEQRRAAAVVAERDRVETALRKILPEVPETQANFVWLPLGDRSVTFAAACEAADIIVRPFAGDGVRVTIGTPEENDAFLAAAEQALA